MGLFDYAVNAFATGMFGLFFWLAASEKKRSFPVFLTGYMCVMFLFITFINMISVTEGGLFILECMFAWLLLSLGTEMKKEQKLLLCSVPSLITGIITTCFTVILKGIIFRNMSFEEIMSLYGTKTTVFVNLVQLAVYVLAAKLHVLHPVQLDLKETFLTFLAVNICNYMTVCYEAVLLDFENADVNLAAGVLLTALLAVLMGYVVYSVSVKNRLIQKEQFENTVLNLEKTYAAEIRNARNEILEIRHDMKHFIRAMFRNGDVMNSDSTMAVLKDYDAKLVEILPPVVSACPVIDYILTLERQEAAEKGIAVKYVLQYSHGPEAAEDNLYLIISNLMDNAIRHIGIEKEIDVKIREKDSWFIIRIANSCERMILDSDGNLVAGDPGFSHGYGLTAVRKAVEESHGKMIFSQEDGKFAVSVLLKSERQPN